MKDQTKYSIIMLIENCWNNSRYPEWTEQHENVIILQLDAIDLFALNSLQFTRYQLKVQYRWLVMLCYQVKSRRFQFSSVEPHTVRDSNIKSFPKYHN